MRYLLLLSFGLLGCQSGGDGGGPDYNLTVRDIWTMELQFSSPSTAAGVPLDLSVVLISEDGDVQDLPEWTLSSDLENKVQYTRQTITPTLGGSHLVTVDGTYNDRSYTATGTLEVSAGTPYTVNLELSDHGMLAGETIQWTIDAADQWGNAIDTSGVMPEIESADIILSATEFTTTVPGTYRARATMDPAADEEVFVVGPGYPDRIELTLNTTEPERYETVHANVLVYDAFSNETDDPWSLWVEGDGDTEVRYNNITFWDEGQYTVFAGVDGTSIIDSVGPFLIDTTGPNIELTEPPRGDWIDGLDSKVSGTITDDWSFITSVTLNDTSVTLDSSGTFDEDMDWDFGINVLETVATDSDGNTSTDTRALIAGNFKNYGQEINNGLAIRIKEGAGGFDTLEALGEGLVSATDLSTLIPSPLYSNSYKRWGVTWYSISLYASNPKIGAVDFDLDPRSTGVLRTTVTVNDTELDWSASGKLAFVSVSGSGDISADDIEVEIDLEPRISGRTLLVDVDRVSTTVTNFDFDMSGWLYDILKFFGVDNVIDSQLETLMETAIEDIVETEVPDILEDALSSLELATDVPIQGTTYTLNAEPASVSVDGSGLNLGLASRFKSKAWRIPYTGLGSLYYGYGNPSYSPSSGMNLGLSGDFLNQVMYALWGGGLLDQTLSASSLGLDTSDFELFFPGLTDLTIELDALLPPAVVPGTGKEMFDLQLGDIHLVLYNGDAATGDVLIDVYFSAFMGMNLGATSDTLSATMGEPSVYFDVVFPEANTAGAKDTEALLVELVPYLLPLLTDALSEIPLPEIDGFAISGVRTNTDGPEDGFLMVRGNLVEK